jgi:AcrR family transcriptional regulator
MATTAPAPPHTPEPPPERLQRADARRNHKRVVRAARACMARDGLDAQMEDIARRAGVGVGTLYRHFRNKEELVEALALDRFERLEELAHEALAEDDPWRSFEGFVRASARIQSDDRALSEVLTQRPDTMSRAAESVGMLDLVSQILGRAQSAGVVRRDAHPYDIPMILCALAGTFRNPHSDPERYIGIALDGLRAAGGRQTRLPPVSDPSS